MAVLLTGNPLKTLKLCPFHPKWLIAGLILPLTLQPLSIELLRHLAWFFPELPAGAAKMLDAASSKNLPLWLALLAFAIAPAICEELAFRGFILSGLQRTHRYRLAAVMSSVAFGIVHTLPQQVFNATLLGLVLAAIALRSGSLIPGVLFHFVFNATQVVVMRLKLEGADVSEAWLRKAPDGQLIFGWPLLAVCAILSAGMLYWLVTGPVAKGWRDERRADDRLDPLSADLAVR
jgi:sodium transport system permease protein